VTETLKALGDLSDAECVALMACHSVGEYHEDVSGIDGGQRCRAGRYRLGTGYYRTLLAAEKSLARFEVTRSEGNRRVLTLPANPVSATLTVEVNGNKNPAEANKAAATPTTAKAPSKARCIYMEAEIQAMLKDKEWRVWVERFANDKKLWKKEFQSGFAKLLNSNFVGDNLRPYSQQRAANLKGSAAVAAAAVPDPSATGEAADKKGYDE
jgi:catalase (peroxidase I)